MSEKNFTSSYASVSVLVYLFGVFFLRLKEALAFLQCWKKTLFSPIPAESTSDPEPVRNPSNLHQRTHAYLDANRLIDVKWDKWFSCQNGY